MSEGLLRNIAQGQPEGLIPWPPSPRDIPSPTPGSGDEGHLVTVRDPARGDSFFVLNNES